MSAAQIIPERQEAGMTRPVSPGAIRRHHALSVLLFACSSATALSIGIFRGSAFWLSWGLFAAIANVGATRRICAAMDVAKIFGRARAALAALGIDPDTISQADLVILHRAGIGEPLI